MISFFPPDQFSHLRIAILSAFGAFSIQTVKAQVPEIDFYFGPNLSILNRIPDHFMQVSADYQNRYNTSQEYLLKQHALGSMWGLRLNFVSRDFSLPLSLEYNRIRKIGRSNVVDFPDKGYTGQYRMKYTANSVGFVFGKCDAPIRFGTHFDFGQIFWKKKYYPESEFRKGKWVPYTETIDFGVLGMARGPVFTGLNISIIGRWKFMEARAYYFLGGKEKYPDYTNKVNYYVNPSHVGFSLCFVPTRT
jgi:hypothetical protein